jgi:hypothetical protein
MAVDTRLLSYWKVARALRAREGEDEAWTSDTLPDAYATLISSREESTTPLRLISHDGPAVPVELRLL